MSAFLVGSPIMAKAAAKPTARVNTTVRAAAAPEGLSRRAAAAGFLALVMSTTAGEANALEFAFPSPPPPPPRGETKRVRTTEKAVVADMGVNARTSKSGGRLPGGGPGFGKNKAPRAFLKDKQAEILEAYGLESLPGQ